MASLKDLKNRINSVKSTQKITSAMKMVAASKLRRAQEQVEASRPFTERMERMMSALSSAFAEEFGESLAEDDAYDAGADDASAVAPTPSAADWTKESDEPQEMADGVPMMIRGTGSNQCHLFLIITSDRGLCGGFNSIIVREFRRRLQQAQKDGKTIKLICVGRKGRDLLRREYGSAIVESYEDLGRQRTLFAEAELIAQKLLDMFAQREFDVATAYYNRFKSVIQQIPTAQQLLPVPPPEPMAGTSKDAADPNPEDPMAPTVAYEYEPDEETVLAELLPYSLIIQVYRALLESSASEQGARMTAMDNATRNAGDMIQKLTLTYNRTRQAAITKELIEIISGAEAL